MRQGNDAFKDDCQRLLRERVFRNNAARWSVDSLTRTVEGIAGLAVGQGETGFGDSWTVVTCRLVGIFRREQYKARRIDDFNRAHQQKS